jgi:hypothetical protein
MAKRNVEHEEISSISQTKMIDNLLFLNHIGFFFDPSKEIIRNEEGIEIVFREWRFIKTFSHLELMKLMKNLFDEPFLYE